MSDTRLIGVCGLTCSDCGAYLATKNNDEVLRAKTAEEWSKRYSVDLKPADIYCVGCIIPSGRHIGHCGECNIRACGQERRDEISIIILRRQVQRRQAARQASRFRLLRFRLEQGFGERDLIQQDSREQIRFAALLQ